MANYLQRVITAGARIHSPAKPPVAVPAILPAALVAPSAQPAPAVSLPRPANRPAPQTPERTVAPAEKLSTDPPAAQAVPPVANRPAVPLAVALARLASGPPIRAPKGIRAEVHLPQAPPPEMPRVETPIASTPTEPPKPAVAHPDAEPRAATPARDVPDIQKTAPDAEVRGVAPVPALPIAAQQPVPVPQAKLERKAAPVQKESPGKPPQPSPVAPPTQQQSAEPPAKVVEETSVRVVEAKPAAAQSNPQIEPVSIQPKSSEQPLAPAIAPERSDTRRSRITIGQIDVQVNNQRAAPTTAQPAAAAGPRTVFFEARYLNRFSMRP